MKILCAEINTFPPWILQGPIVGNKKKNSSRPEELEVIDQFLFYTTKDKEEDTNVSDSLERSVKFRGFR
jgi:hypothetical protein